jgi:hypothetical protein
MQPFRSSEIRNFRGGSFAQSLSAAERNFVSFGPVGGLQGARGAAILVASAGQQMIRPQQDV